jgi:hypothetical protein
MSNYGRLRALDDILKERDKQDEQWGGPDHDDTHDQWDWLDYIDHQKYRWVEVPNRGRETLVKIAALALAAIESIDRKEKSSANA